MFNKKLNLFNLLTGIWFLFVAALIIFFTDKKVFSYRRYFLLPNTVLFLIGAAFLLCILFLSRLIKNTKIGAVLSDVASKPATVRIFFVVFFIFQLLVCYGAYFETAWDVKMVLDNARILADAGILASPDYFSTYPNNLFLLKFVSGIFSVFGNSKGLCVLLVISALFNCLSGFCTFRVMRRFFGVGRAWLGLLFWLILTGTSPWILVPYSDSMSVVFPILIIDLVLAGKEASRNKKLLLYIIASILAAIAFRIKPQAFIVVIALIICELPAIFKPGNKSVKAAFIAIPCLTLVLSFFFTGVWARHSFNLDKEKQFTFTHFLMMGSSFEHDGIYNDDDVSYSASFSTVKERQKANLEVFGARISSMGPNIFKHLATKLRVCFHDGTFEWGGDESFYHTIYPEKLPVISRVSRVILYGGGIFQKSAETIRQCFWLVTLALLGISALFRSKKETAFLFLAVIGLTAFLLIFEANARYLFSNIPLFIVTALSFKLPSKQV